MMDQFDNSFSKQHEWESKLVGMRTNFEHRMKNYIPLDSQKEELHHGLYLTSAIILLQKYADVCYCSEKQVIFTNSICSNSIYSFIPEDLSKNCSNHKWIKFTY